MKKILLLWPIFFILGIWLLFSHPFFFSNKVPYPSENQVNFFHPWAEMKEFWGPVKNNAMPDVIDQMYPWKHFTIQTLKMGQIPFWNPNSFSGNPHLANYQSAVLSPFNILYFVFPFVDAWSIVILLQPLLAGIFMYLFIRAIKVSKEGALVGSIAFMFCGFIVVWMAYGTLSMAIAFLPLSFFAIEKYEQTKRIKFLVLLSLSIPLSIFSGHFQTSLYFLLTIGAFAFYKGISLKSIGLIIRFVMSGLFGLVLSLPQLLPSMEFYNYSVRSGIYNQGGGIPWWYFVTIFSPDFFGNPVTRNDWYGYYAEFASFIGIIPFFLSFYALLAKKKTYSLFFFLAGIISVMLAVASPLQNVIGELKIPVLSTSSPNRIIVLFSFFFAVLSGLGLDSLKELIFKDKTKKILFPIVIFVLLFASVWLLIFSGKILDADKLLTAKRNFVLPSALLFAACVSIFVSKLIKKILILSVLFFVLATAFSSFRFAQKWMPFDPKDLVFPEESVINAAQKNIGNGRLFGNLGAFIDTYYNLPSIEGYDPLYIQRYGEFIRFADTGQFEEAERSVAKLNRIGKYTDRVLDFLGVSLIFNPVADTNQSWAFHVWEDPKHYSVIYSDRNFQLFKNNQALPRTSLFYKTEVLQGKDILKRFYSDNFNFRENLIIETPLFNVLQTGTGSAKIKKYTPDEVEIEANSTSSAMLLLTDNYYPGWIVTVNGEKEKIYRADYTFRAVLVPKGKSIVKFTYEGWHI